jgi:hypothetical protein
MMEGSGEFLPRLVEAVANRGAWIEAREIARLRDSLRSFHSLFESIVGMLLRKGLLREDPYNYDQSVTELAVPRDDPLPEIENTEELSYRLAAYRRQLEFLATGCALTLATLDLAQLKKVSGLVSYVNWADFSEGSRSPMTRAFARIIMKVRMGADTMAAGIIKDSQTQIEKAAAAVRTLVAEIVAFHRESWKADVRGTVFPRIPPSAPAVRARREETLRSIRKVFLEVMPGRSYFPELIEEILAEDSAEDGGVRQEKILEALTVTEHPAQAPAQAVQTKPILLEAARILSRAHSELTAALDTLVENERALEDRHLGFGEKIRRWLLRGIGQKEQVQQYEVEYNETAVPTALQAPTAHQGPSALQAPSPKLERVAFPTFVAETRKAAAVLASLATPSGLARLESAAEQPLIEFIDRQICSLLLIHRRMAGLNAVFQSRAVGGRKAEIKGIRLELVAVKNSIVKANQRRHEYAARREEQEQLGRLGLGGAE